MSDNPNKFGSNGSQKSEAREPDAILPAGYEDFEDEEADYEDEDEYYAYSDEDEEEGDEEDDGEYYEEEEESQYPSDPYALAQQLASSPLFAQVQAMLGGNTSIEGRMNTARLHQVSGDLEAAAETYLDIIEEEPEYQKAYISLGQTLLAMDQPERAETFLEKAIELDPEDASGYLYLGYTHYAQQDFEKCVVDFRHTVEVDPDSHLAWNNLGYAQYLCGRLDEAEKTFIKAGDVGNNRAYYNLGMVRLIQDKPEKAWEAYQDAADLDPHGSQIEDHLEDLEKAKERYPDRAALLDEAIQRLNERLGTDDDEDYEEDEDEPED